MEIYKYKLYIYMHKMLQGLQRENIRSVLLGKFWKRPDVLSTIGRRMIRGRFVIASPAANGPLIVTLLFFPVFCHTVFH